jgi:transposase InsO family protein
MKSYLDYLSHGVLPEDVVTSRQIVCRATAYTIINGSLYKRSTNGVFLRCVSPAEGQQILKDMHEEECGHHASSRTLVAKDFRHGFVWLMASTDAKKIVDYCIGCQKYKSQPLLLATALKTIPITWPFVVWGIDMGGPFKRARGLFTHLLVAVDKFTKWVEAKPIRKLDADTATKFLQEIIHRYGYPHSIITDNGTNFNKSFSCFCRVNGIRLDLTSVAHPESNGQAERAN